MTTGRTAAIEPEDPAGTLRRSPEADGVDAERPVIAMGARRPRLNKCKTTVRVHTTFAARFDYPAVDLAVEAVHQLLIGVLVADEAFMKEKTPLWLDEAFEGSHRVS